MKRIVFLIVLLCLAGQLLHSQKAAAINTKPLVTVSPFLQEVVIKDSDSNKDFIVTLINNSDVEQTFKLAALDFGALNNTAGVVFAGSSADSLVSKYGLSNWMQLADQLITLKAGESSEVRVTIKNDNSLRPGGHYGAVVATLQNDDSESKNQVLINQKLSSLIFLTKTNGAKYDLVLDKIEAKKTSFNLPDSIKLYFKNPGNVHVVPRGVVKLLSSDNKVLASGTINEESAYVLPETTRQLSVKLRSLSSRIRWPGNYRLVVDYRYDGIDQFAHKEQTFYFFNLFFVFPIVLALIVLAKKKLNWIRKIFRKKKPIKNM